MKKRQTIAFILFQTGAMLAILAAPVALCLLGVQSLQLGFAANEMLPAKTFLCMAVFGAGCILISRQIDPNRSRRRIRREMKRARNKLHEADAGIEALDRKIAHEKDADNQAFLMEQRDVLNKSSEQLHLMITQLETKK